MRKSKKSVDKRVMMRIEKIIENKKQFLDLLLLADEQKNMYEDSCLERSTE
jgi:hypothetical protein